MRLGDVADTALGKMLDAARPKGRERVPYLRNINVQWGRIDTDDVREVALNADEQERFELKDGDLLVCEGGEIGRAAIWRGGGEYMAYQKALHRIRSRGDLDLSYVRYLLEHYANTGDLRSRATGSTILHLPQQKLRELPIPMPSLAGQRQIVELLEDHLSRLDAAARGLGIVEDRLHLLKLARLEAIKRMASAADQTTLGDLAVAAGYGTSAKCVVGGPGQAVVRIPNLIAGTVEMSDEKRIQDPLLDVSSTMLHADDLLVVRTNGSRDLIGRTAVTPGGTVAAFASYLIRYRIDASQASADWVHLVMQTPSTRSHLESMAASSAGQYNLSLSKLNTVAIPKPSLREQAALVSESRRMVDAIDRAKAQIEIVQMRAIALRRALLAAAFAGRLTACSAVSNPIKELALV